MLYNCECQKTVIHYKILDDLDKLRQFNFEMITKLTVEDTSAFSSCLESHTCTVTETIVLECEVKDAEADVTWYCNGKAIVSDSDKLVLNAYS